MKKKRLALTRQSFMIALLELHPATAGLEVLKVRQTDSCDNKTTGNLGIARHTHTARFLTRLQR